ncbi:hypothetical protein SteCoe_21026 [Stentor coeruleus]|uniref:Uncharacterized protein n=1 Tax=Stentor coeruleus TaxID=5963 RepID=A0A1R2BQG6_9CILI|nr:hypothetical protein SteCoe_21026 [Stentor coeruleus]
MWFLLMLAIAYQKDIFDGESLEGEIVPQENDKQIYRFMVGDQVFKDLQVAVTWFSDSGMPAVYVSINKDVSESFYEYSSNHWDLPAVIVPATALLTNTMYYILIQCSLYCEYILSVSYASNIKLTKGTPLVYTMPAGYSLMLSYTFISDKAKKVTFTTNFVGNVIVRVSNTDTLEGPDFWPEAILNSLNVLEYCDTNTSIGMEYKIYIQAVEDSDFKIIALENDDSIIRLQASVPQKDIISRGNYKYYKVYKDKYSESLSISLTVFRGDADILISFSSSPILSDFDYYSPNIGNDNILISKNDFFKHSFTEGYIFISIYGATESVFSLTATFIGLNGIKLTKGIPHEGHVQSSKIVNFYYIINENDQNITIYLTTLQGNPDLYVKYCEKKCNLDLSEIEKESGLYSNKGSLPLESLDFTTKNSPCPINATCMFAIAVYGKIESIFSILLSTQDTDILLQEGHSFIISSPFQDQKNFIYVVHNSSVSEVSFIITPLHGDPDLYVSSLSKPSETSFEKASVNYGTSLEIVNYTKGLEKESLQGKYYISVLNNEGVYYSIIAKEMVPGKNSSLHLYSGHPQKDTVYNQTQQNFRIYNFNIPKAHDLKPSIKIALTVISGKFAFYVANSPNSFNWDTEDFAYNWFAEAHTGDPNIILTISPTDPFYIVDSSYLILVTAIKFAPDSTASYLIQYIIGNDILMLSEDSSISGHVDENSYSFYAFPIHFLHEDLTISLTVSSGDPDLYINFDNSNPRPCKDNYVVKSSNFGSEIITLLWEDQLSSKCPNLKNNGQNNGCYVYISVYAIFASSYSIRVHPSSKIPKFIASGSSVFGSLAQSEYDFYYGFFDPFNSIIVVLASSQGNSDLYVNIVDKKSLDDDMSKWIRPTEKNYLYYSNTMMTDEIEIKSFELHALCSDICAALISVKCETLNCEFVVDVSQEELSLIIEGQAKSGVVGMGFKYYFYFCDKETEDLLIVLTTMSSCSPGLYMTKSKTSKPTRENYTWKSTSGQSESILITPEDEFLNGKTMKGTYIIGVTSEKEACSYTLTITNHAIPVIILSSGVPQQGFISKHELNYYAFYNTLSEDIVINLTPNSGSPYLLINTHNDLQGEFYSDLPQLDKYKWNSNFASDKYSLTILTTDKGYCNFCYYLIGISSENSSNYVINARTDLTIRVLQNGVPFKSEGKLGQWHVYRFQINSKQDIHISLAEYSGIANIYVTDSYNKTTALWKSEMGQFTKSVHIKSNDVLFYQGDYYILIGSEDSDYFYSVLWYSEDSSISLIDGWPLEYSLTNNKSNHVNLRYTSYGKVYCSLESLTLNSYPLVYTLVSDKPSNSYDIMFSEIDYVGNHLSMSFSVDQNQNLFLKIHDYITQTTVAGEFSIYCTNSFHPAILQSNRLTIGSVNEQTKALRYEINILKPTNMNVYIIPCIGELKMEVSTNWTVIKEETPDLSVSKLIDGVLHAHIKQAIGKYYITVSEFTNSTSASFQILADLKQLERVYAGNNGFINWDQKGSNLYVRWKDLEYSNKTIYEDKILYSIYQTKDQNTIMRSSCEIFYAETHGQAKLLGSTYNLSMKIFMPIELAKGFINVLGVVAKPKTVALGNIPFNLMEYEMDIEPRRPNKIIIVSIVALILLLICTTVFFFIKFKKVESEKIVIETQGKIVTQNDDTIVVHVGVEKGHSNK